MHTTNLRKATWHRSFGQYNDVATRIVPRGEPLSSIKAVQKQKNVV